MENSKSTPFLTQESIAPGAIKQRHLVASPTQKGDMYYGLDGNSFANLKIGANGAVLYANNSIPVWLPIGSSSQVLTVTGGLPVWVTPAASGNTVTLLTNSTFTGSSTSSASLVDITNCVTSSITTTKTANVLITFTGNFSISNSARANWQIVRGSTSIGPAAVLDIAGSGASNTAVSMTVVDAALAAGTYTWKVQHDTSANTLTTGVAVITAMIVQ